MAHGAKINVKDDGNNTPLHKACERNSTLKVVELLVDRGASLTAANNNGETPLDMAIKNDKKSIVIYLKGLPRRRRSCEAPVPHGEHPEA